MWGIDVLALDAVLGADGELVAVADEDPLLRGHDVGRGAVLAGDAGHDLALLDEVAGGGEHLRRPAGSRSGASYCSTLVTLTFVPASPRMISTIPSMWLISALPLGTRASKSSSTRGRPAVMSAPPAEATPPVWNVRIVSCVPGSPIDWAAMIPTASPVPTSEPGREVAAVAAAADAVAGLAGERRADEHLADRRRPRSRRAIASLISSLRSHEERRRRAPTIGAAARRPTSRRANAPGSRVTSSDSARVIQLPSSVPQSSSRVMTSWATSTRRRVR